MPANTAPIFVLTPNVGTARLTAASTSRDASVTTNITTCFTAGANGSRVDEVLFQNSNPAASGASTANVMRLYYVIGGVYKLLKEVTSATVTPSATAIGALATMTFSGGLIIPTGATLAASMQTAGGSSVDQTDVICRGGDY